MRTYFLTPLGQNIFIFIQFCVLVLNLYFFIRYLTKPYNAPGSHRWKNISVVYLFGAAMFVLNAYSIYDIQQYGSMSTIKQQLFLWVSYGFAGLSLGYSISLLVYLYIHVSRSNKQ